MAVRKLFALLIIAFAVSSAVADTNTAVGDRSGEGPTPFTGLAQTPDANLFTGAATTAIPIQIPPGRNKMTPQLRLQYSSTGGAGPFGYGWDLPLGSIQRSTKWGAPRCTGPHADEFVLSLASATGELVQVDGSDSYRLKIEQQYFDIAKDESSNSWIAHDASGTEYIFGDQPTARVGNNTSTFEQADPNDDTCQYTTGWALTHIEDTNGNTIDIMEVGRTKCGPAHRRQ